MEKHSIDRFVGGGGKQQEELRKVAERRFEDQKPLDANAERPKTPEELEMIELVNRETDRLREKYGLPGYRVPPENYHAIRKEKHEDVLGNWVRGSHNIERQDIRFGEADSPRLTLHTLFHETVHFKSFSSVDVAERRKRRLGLTTREGQDELFNALNEAVTEELTKRFMRQQEDRPWLAKETDLMRRVREKVGDQRMEDIVAVRIGEKEGQQGVHTTSFSYPEERKALSLLIDKLAERNPKAYMKKEDWFDEFASAMFNGHLLQLARDIEETFGTGTFRKLGQPKTGEELLEFVESL